MDNKLVVSNSVSIDASVAKVWEMLVAPKYIRQWNSLPQDYGDYYLELGSSIEWIGASKLVVVECEANTTLKLSLYVAKWELPPASYDIAYTYSLAPEDKGVTILSLSIGDFATLPDGNEYYNLAEEFSEAALDKIKKLAENRI